MSKPTEAQYVRAFNAAAAIAAASDDLSDASIEDVAEAVSDLTVALAEVQAAVFPKEAAPKKTKSSGRKSSGGSRKSSGRKGKGGGGQKKAITDGQLGFIDNLKDQIEEAGGDYDDVLEDVDVEELTSYEASKLIEELIEVRDDAQGE